MQIYFDTLRGAKMAGKRRGWQYTGTRRSAETGKYTIYEMGQEWLHAILDAREATARETALLMFNE